MAEVRRIQVEVGERFDLAVGERVIDADYDGLDGTVALLVLKVPPSRRDCPHAECPRPRGCAVAGLCMAAAASAEPWDDPSEPSGVSRHQERNE